MIEYNILCIDDALDTRIFELSDPVEQSEYQNVEIYVYKKMINDVIELSFYVFMPKDRNNIKKFINDIIELYTFNRSDSVEKLPFFDIIFVDNVLGDNERGYRDLIPRLYEITPFVPIVLYTAEIDKVHNEIWQAKEPFWQYVSHFRKSRDKNKPSVVMQDDQIIKVIENNYKESPVDIDHLKKADEFSDSYDDTEEKYLATRVYFKQEEEEIRNFLEKTKKSNGGELNILELGCGTGRLSGMLAEYGEVTAIDFSSGMLNKAKNKLKGRNINLKRMPAEYIGDFLGRDKKFDVIIAAFGFLSYVNTYRTLEGISKVLKDKGFLFISVYNYDSIAFDLIKKGSDLTLAAVPIRELGLLRVANKIDFRAYCFKIDELESLLSSYGFQKECLMTFPVCSVSAKANQFDEKNLWHLDLQISKALRNRGHYILGWFRKVNRQAQ
ncbi:class I SAM-dependent methyltransferase [Hydrogenivirga sp. 128-5-R1-1]|uniref:class I SAM-dependent methyltransferase n=1 Tax=Hydrogenivirga sp. 128-5-R1-1 TaxID=392423 RepID=UPI00015F341D|nr:class I SAM-dependent methyltransferase [Hydrogenivirga sp. 128-5-R1-1]EDP74868.1 phosphatidylethanolamine N-methyltransferase [Hydrogenivirga sp. 128-5-R1-1]